MSDIKKVHFIGIGGIGMSALARLCHHEGKVVTGTNDNPSPQTLDALCEMGISISLDTSVLPETDLYVYSEAWHNLNPALLKKAFDSGIPTINYFDALGMVANEYYLIAVAGSHGKTTTTAMIIDILEEAGLDPSGVVGSLRAKTKSNYRAGKSKYFVVEACEYKRDFLSLTPDVLVITNIEHEHVDYYKSLKDVQDAFTEFAGQVREGGAVIVNFGGQNIAPILEGVRAKVIDYGKYFDPMLKLKIPGMHNQMNASAGKAVAEFIGVERDVAKTALQNFAGTWRRFEYKGELNGAKVYDDYGHHPTEIKATLQGARELYPDKKITLVFQSHTYTRTHELFDNFVEALGHADSVIVLPIYAAREENTSGVSHTKLV
ncbi:MAG: UDP-N-acetylmuramate--L-alanine ligase, partial [Candidatus Kaiserbacteria bacterium]|nr:UDP-N-acetylmuramate--L-alanine ligase [Candidatus Kaiserbacteria bacterium]